MRKLTSLMGGRAYSRATKRTRRSPSLPQKRIASTRSLPRVAYSPVNLAHEGRFDYLLDDSTGFSEPLPAAEPRLGRRTALTFPLLPPPQKN
jgi:hypothetical protein